MDGLIVIERTLLIKVGYLLSVFLIGVPFAAQRRTISPDLRHCDSFLLHLLVLGFLSHSKTKEWMTFERSVGRLFTQKQVRWWMSTLLRDALGLNGRQSLFQESLILLRPENKPAKIVIQLSSPFDFIPETERRRRTLKRTQSSKRFYLEIWKEAFPKVSLYRIFQNCFFCGKTRQQNLLTKALQSNQPHLRWPPLQLPR